MALPIPVRPPFGGTQPTAEPDMLARLQALLAARQMNQPPTGGPPNIPAHPFDVTVPSRVGALSGGLSHEYRIAPPDPLMPGRIGAEEPVGNLQHYLALAAAGAPHNMFTAHAGMPRSRGPLHAV